MIYLDVTNACLLPLQGGIPRTTRQLARLIGEHFPENQLLCWQPFRHTYTRLTARARQLLDHPQIATESPPPRDTTLPLLEASLRQLFAWASAIPLHRLLQHRDIFLITSLFPDNRLEYLLHLAHQPGCKIAIFHDAIPLRDPNVRGWEKERHLKTLHLLGHMNSVIAVSEAAGDDLLALWQKHKIVPAPVKVIRWPVPFTDSRPAFADPPLHKKNILYVSRLKQMKNHLTLLKACEHLWRSGSVFSLTLIGCEDEARESAAILKEVRRLQSESRDLSWHAQVSESDLHAAYQRASFTVFPSTQEGFGLPIVESFWHGRAVICSGSGAMGEISRGVGCLQIDHLDLEKLIDSIDSLLHNDAHCLTLAREAYGRAQRSWADYWQELASVLIMSGKETAL